MKTTAAILLVVGGLLTACTSAAPQTPLTITQTITHSLPPATPSTPKNTAAINPGPTTAVPADCPYIDIPTAQDLEGNRIADHWVLRAGGKVVGCRFQFWTNDHAVLEITSERFHTPTDAYNAMVRTGQRGHNIEGAKNLVPGVDGVLYQTTFYAPDGNNDWACTFAKGPVVVTVKTDQDNTSQNARNLATAIASRF